MTWPTTDVNTANTDADTDQPLLARADLLDLIQKFNLLRAHMSTFARTFLDDADAASVIATLGAGAVGAATFAAVTQADAQAAIGISNAFFTTGDGKITIKTVADTGWVLFNDTTLGNAASAATGRANADTVALWTLLYNNTADADCAVSGGRTGNAANDYAANKTIALPKALGRALCIYGAGSGLTARAMAKIIGDEILQAHNHTGTTGDDNPGHTHGGHGAWHANVASGRQVVTGAGVFCDLPNVDGTGVQQTTDASVRHQHPFTTASTGTGSGGNMQPSLFLNFMIKL